MALSVNTNIGALNALAAASETNRSMETSMARLASGKRINAASDDAAGMAITSRLTAEIRGTNMAIRNASDGQSMIDTAEGAQNEIVNILQRMRELATQASNDTNNAQDRTNISGEMGQLKTEIDRIANTTAWAGVKLLDGNSTAQAINLQVGSNTSSYDKLTVQIDSVTAGKLGIVGSAAGAQTSGEVGSGGVSASAGNLSQASFAAGVLTLSGTLSAGNVSFIVTTATGSATTITVAVTTALEGTSGSARDAVARLAADKLNEANTGYMGVASTDGTGKVTVTHGGVNVSSSTAAGATVATIDAALNTVNTQRAKLGATSNRLDSTISNLTNISANLTAGKGRVEDADFAGESTNMARSQILQQAATAMLAQANASKQGVLQLLQR